MSTHKNEERYLVPGLVRGVEILRLFSANRRVISAPSMANELGIPRSTVFRLAQTLEHLGLLERAEDNRSYRLSVGLLGLGFEYIAALDVTEIGRTELETLRDKTGHSVHMVVRDGLDVVVVLKVSGFSAFSGSLSLGTRLPAHATVLGRTMLSDLSHAELQALYPDGQLETFSNQTPHTLDDLMKLLDKDRVQGHSISQSFYERGISAIAAPVYDHSGRVIAAINITVPGEADISASEIEAVRACAGKISAALNFDPSAKRAIA